MSTPAQLRGADWRSHLRTCRQHPIWLNVPPACILTLIVAVLWGFVYLLTWSNAKQVYHIKTAWHYILWPVYLLLAWVLLTWYLTATTDAGTLSRRQMLPHKPPTAGPLTPQSFQYLLVQPANLIYKRSIPTMCAPRYCRRCSIFKPDRLHHCHSHQQCVLRMDHCCGVINACIGAGNQKLFLQMLLSISMLALYVCAVGIYYRSWVWYRWKVHFVSWLLSMYITVVGAAAFLATGGFFVWQLYLVSQNMTSIEFNESLSTQSRTIKSNPWQLPTVYQNLCVVLGDNPWYWLLPVPAHVHFSHDKRLRTEKVVIEHPDAEGSEEQQMLQHTTQQLTHRIAQRLHTNGNSNETASKTPAASTEWLKLVCSEPDHAVVHLTADQPQPARRLIVSNG